MKQYDHKKIEKKWQGEWAETGLYNTPDSEKGKENAYILTEFSYPSGDLHTGHWYAFALPDIHARFLRMGGKNVLYPAGFDAFGLPAENAAIKHKLSPRDWTYANMERMRGQLASMGTSFDWSREIITCEPAYYKWTQWMFLKMFERGIAYKRETQVNWCPSCKTVLANEQIVGGVCDRCGSEVEKRNMLQWNLRITDYAERLLEDLEHLEWPEEIKTSQRNWIGKSDGARLRFGVADSELSIEVFTTRPDTLFGATYLVLSPEHDLLDRLAEQAENTDVVIAYASAAQKKTEIERTAEGKEKTGVKLEGVWAVNPGSEEPIPVFVADYVLAHYGTGAIMAVPAHDQRDFEFAQQYNLPITPVIEPVTGVPQENPEFRKSIVAIVRNKAKDKVLCINWKDLGGYLFVGGGREDGEDPIQTACREIQEETGYTQVSFVAKTQTIHHNYFAHSKGVARKIEAVGLLFDLADGEQEPQALEKNEEGKFVYEWLALNDAEARVKDELHKTVFEILVRDRAYTGEGVLFNSGAFDGMKNADAKRAITDAAQGEIAVSYKLRDWVVSRQRYWGVPIPIIHCAACGPVAVPDAELPVLLPEIDDYLPRDDGKSPLSKANDWVSVPCPRCGGNAERETDTLDTFVDSSWYFLRYTDPDNKKEFAARDKQDLWMPVDLYSGGAEHTTMHLLYSRFWHKVLFDMGYVGDAEPYRRRMNRGLILGPDGNKMSKSKGNVINPDEIVEQLGADTVRTYLAFIGPFNEVGHYPWNPDGAVGIRRFLERVWRINETCAASNVAEAEPQIHRAIKKVTEDVAALKFNTAIAALMSLINSLEKSGVGKAQYERLLLLLAPFAPHMTEELWHMLGNTESIHRQAWPLYDPEQLKEETVLVVVQVNGKVRGRVVVPADAGEDAVREAAEQDEGIAKWLAGMEPQKVIFVPNRLVNFVF